MVSGKRMRGLISRWEALDACIWQVAEGYVVYDGEIRPDYEAGGWKTEWYRPLADQNLFLSFSRLGALGNELSEAAILNWVRKRGLLQLKDQNEDRRSLDNQAPITLSAFREEADQAYKALTLFNAIRSGDFDALRSRISYVPVDPLGRPVKSGDAYVHVDGSPVPMMRMAGSETSDVFVRIEAIHGLEYFVSSRLTGLNLYFDAESGHARPREVYRPKLALNIPDLWRAIWYQFALLMSDTRPTKFCEFCEGPIFHPRSNQRTCSDACRQAKRRRQKARESSPS